MPRTRASSPATRALPVLALALAVLAGCLPPAADPALDADRLAALTAEVADLPGVVDATGPGPVAQDEWTEVSVQSDVTSAAAYVALAADVADLLPDHGRTSARVWQRDVPGLPDLAVQVAGGDDDVAGRLEIVAALAALPATTGLQVLPDTVSASTADASGLPEVAAVVAPLRVPFVLLGTDDQRVTSYVRAGVLDARVAGLVARLDAWPGVTSQFVGDEGTGEAWVRVQVQGDDTVEELADALEGTTWPQDAAAVHVVVSSSFRERGLVVGHPGPTAEEVGPAADATPAPDDGLPACTGADLTLRIAGFDAALGRRYLTVRARNDSGAACTVEGRPGIAFERASGTTAPDVETGTPTGTAAPQRLVLQPRQEARSELTWRGMSTALDPNVTVALLVTAVPGADAVRVPVDGSGLDVLAGAVVEIGAWLPAED